MVPRASYYNLYIIGIGIGTFAGNLVFIFGGKMIAQKLNASQSIINWVIGGIFAITAIVFLIKILLNRDGTDKLKVAEEEGMS